MVNGMWSRYCRNQREAQKIKNDPKKYEEHKRRQREYVRKNREKVNERSRKYHKEMREVARDLGNCTVCYKEKNNHKFKHCIKCRKDRREYYKRWKMKAKSKQKTRKVFGIDYSITADIVTIINGTEKNGVVTLTPHEVMSSKDAKIKKRKLKKGCGKEICKVPDVLVCGSDKSPFKLIIYCDQCEESIRMYKEAGI